MLSKYHLLVYNFILIFLYSLILTTTLLINWKLTILYIVTPNILLLSRSLFLNKKYLKKIEINEDKEIVVLEIVRYEKTLIDNRIKLSDLNIKIIENLFSFGPSYRLLIFENNKLIHKQYETIGWDRKTFIEIHEKVEMINGRKSYTSWISK